MPGAGDDAIISAGTINWSAGTMSGSGSTTATVAANFTGSSNITLDGRTFNNAGTATWDKADFLTLQTATSPF